MECNYDQPCGDGQMCDLHESKCRPLTVPKEKNRLLVGTQSGAFVGRSTAIDLMIARQFTQQLGVPCTLGKEGITTEDEFVEAISEGEDLVAIIDLFTGENLCLMWEELKEAWGNSQMGLHFVEGKAEQGERKEVVNFPYWEDKYILKSAISRQFRVEKYMFAIVPTQYRIELGGDKRYIVYHVVPVGPYRQELIEVKQPEFPRHFPEDLEGVVAEFRGPQLLEMSFADVAEGEEILAIAFNGVYLAVVIASEDELVGLIVVWDTRNQKLVRQKPEVVPFFHDINCMFSPKDPNILAHGAEDGNITIWNIDTNQSVNIGRATFIFPQMTFDDNGIFYYQGSDLSISRYDVVHQQYVGVVNSRQRFVAFTVNSQGTRLIAVTNLNNLRIFDLEMSGFSLDDKLIKERRLNLFTDINSIDSNSDGDVVVFTTDDGSTRLWLPDTEDDFVRLETPSEATNATDVHFNSSDSRILALVDGPDDATAICVWDSDSLELIQVIPLKSPPIDIDMIVDPVNPNRVLTSDTSGLVKMWEID